MSQKHTSNNGCDENMLKVELIYDFDCPNVSLIRKLLKKALIEVNLKPHWIEWNRSDKQAPNYVMKYASPTILINGKDVGILTSEISGDAACRIYSDESGKLKGVPSIMQIKVAILKRMPPQGSK